MPNAICSFWVWWSETLRSSTIRPTGRGGNTSSGQTFVLSRGSKSSSGCSSSVMSCTRSSHSGKSPAAIASYRSFEAWPRSSAWTAAASAAVRLRTPAVGIQWYLTRWVTPSALTHL